MASDLPSPRASPVDTDLDFQTRPAEIDGFSSVAAHRVALHPLFCTGLQAGEAGLECGAHGGAQALVQLPFEYDHLRFEVGKGGAVTVAAGSIASARHQDGQGEGQKKWQGPVVHGSTSSRSH